MCLAIEISSFLQVDGVPQMNEEFTKWVNSVEGNLISNVVIADFPDTGRGLKAIVDIHKGDTIVQIPGDIIFSSLNIRKSALFNQISEMMFPTWAITGIMPTTGEKTKRQTITNRTLITTSRTTRRGKSQR
jgi:hypothetical protein